MVSKGKTASKLVGKFVRGKVAKQDDHEKEAVEAEPVTDATTCMEVEEPSDAKVEEGEVAAREKELKAMQRDDLKELNASLGLAKGKKADMVLAILAHEEKARQAQEEGEARLRGVVVKKIEELTAKDLPELRDACKASGITGTHSKKDCVDSLVAKWQETGGVAKALAKIASDTREAELFAMDAPALRKVCEKAAIDPLVKEVMLDRINRRENDLGMFSPPTRAKAEVAPSPAPEDKADLVAMMLAKEAAKKKQMAEEEAQKAREAALVKKKEELDAKTMAELKQILARKGLAAAGTKGDLVDALCQHEMEAEALAAKNGSLKALGKDGLKDLLTTKGLHAAGGVDSMIDSLLQHEARCEEELREYEAKVVEQLKKTKEALQSKSGSELKDLCAASGLAAGALLEDRVQRLLHRAMEVGEIDAAIAADARAARREVLSSMEKPTLLKLCEEVGAQPFVKEVMVERILAHETEGGRFRKAEDEAATAQPPTKKARTGEK